MERKHVHETNPKRTIVTVIIFVAIILVGLLTIRNPKLKYTLSPQQTVELVTQEEDLMDPYELMDILTGKIDTVILIDIRDKFEYGRGHIEGAENIAAITLLNEENIKRLEEFKETGMTVVIYGNDQLQANGPWMVFRQLGFNNVKVLPGGFDFYNEWKNMPDETLSEDSYMLGAPRFDYAKVATSASGVENAETGQTTKPITITRRKKSKVAEGGC